MELATLNQDRAEFSLTICRCIRLLLAPSLFSKVSFVLKSAATGGSFVEMADRNDDGAKTRIAPSFSLTICRSFGLLLAPSLFSK